MSEQMSDPTADDPLEPGSPGDAAGGDQAPAGSGLREVAPDIARLAGGAWWRAAERTAGVYLRAGNRVVKAAVAGESVEDLLHDARAYTRELLGIVSERATNAGRRQQGPATPSTLRDRGAELLRRSTDVNLKEDAHPAYARILSELAPDEARILRLLVTEGAQPTVDVRTHPPLNVGSQLLAPGLSMIGEQAGCRHLDQVPAYLTNLDRLGLIWFSRESLEDPLRYQVLEAQPDVLAAIKSVRRARTVRRRIHLTPLGRDFCEMCLPLDTVEFEALPSDSTPGAYAVIAPDPDTDASQGDEEPPGLR